MKKLLAALSAAGLMVGIGGVFGSSAATASAPHIAQPFTVLATPTTGIAVTGPTTISATYTGATDNGTVEYGICNDDASNKSPLVKPTAACTAPALSTASASGTGSFTIVLHPGDQGSSLTSGCPQSKTQYGLGIQCIVAALDFGTDATSDVPLYFQPKAGVLTSAGAFMGKFTIKGGYATDGLFGSSPATLATGCQSFSKTATASWTTLPLCNDGANNPAGTGGPLPAGDGFATGEPVEVILGGGVPADDGLQCNPTLAPNAAGACPYADADAPTDVNTPGGLTYTFTFPNTGAKETWTMDLTGASSGVTQAFTVKVSKTGVVS